MAHEGENLESSLVDFTAAVRHDANNDLLPSFSPPHLGAITATQVSNILDDPSHRTTPAQHTSEGR